MIRPPVNFSLPEIFPVFPSFQKSVFLPFRLSRLFLHYVSSENQDSWGVEGREKDSFRGLESGLNLIGLIEINWLISLRSLYRMVMVGTKWEESARVEMLFS